MFQSLHLTVIDPGLMAASGHHAGFAMFLAKSIRQEQGHRVNIYCHAEIDADLQADLHQSGIFTAPFFQSNFYEHYDDETNSANIKDYIAQLCAEYIRAFSHISQGEGDKHRVIFYPCLNWEHACALAMALEHQKEIARSCPHVVCAMYNPGINPDFELLCRSRRLNFHLGFHALKKHTMVSIFASDFELGQIYRRLLADEKGFAIHPCYLADWCKFDAVSRPEHPLRIFIYLGDAKASKGFSTLPEFIRKNIHLLSSNDRFVIQYTLSWDSPELASTIEWLNEFSAKDPRLELHTEFWQYDTLMQQLTTASLVVFLYQEEAYQVKSSGFIWLAGWSDTPVALSNNSWLSRESSRLGLRALYLQNYNLQPILEELHSAGHTTPSRTAEQDQYRSSLYQPFWPWITAIASTNTDTQPYA